MIGTTGSGKSTLANSILRLFDISEGDILIDDNKIEDFDVVNLRRQIGYVPQTVFLFDDSIIIN